MAKIMVVDDQESILKTVEALLKKAGHEVILASDGYIALEKVAVLDLDLLITDANMPGISGFDLVKSLRLNDRTSDIPMIMMTSRRERRDVEKAINVRLDDYVIKPIDPEMFVAKVAGLLGKSGPAVPAAPVGETGELRLVIKMETLSEQGMTLQCSLAIPVGSRIPLQTSFFGKIGIASQEMRVISCSPRDGGFRIDTQFTKLSADELAKLKKWVASRLPKAG